MFKHQNKRIIVLLTLVFLLPVFFSWMVYFYYGYFHFRTSNHGVLINPPIQMIDKLQLHTHQWQILFVPDQCLDENSNKILFNLHQICKALGENKPRVKLILLVSPICEIGASPHYSITRLKSEFDLTLKKFLKKEDDFFKNKIYLIDPGGNLFMYYSSETRPSDILQDLKKVLRI